MSSLSATRRASSASLAEQQPCLWSARGLKIGSWNPDGPSTAQASCASSPCRMNAPITSWPASLSSQAATLESTPPDIARTMRDIGKWPGLVVSARERKSEEYSTVLVADYARMQQFFPAG